MPQFTIDVSRTRILDILGRKFEWSAGESAGKTSWACLHFLNQIELVYSDSFNPESSGQWWKTARVGFYYSPEKLVCIPGFHFHSDRGLLLLFRFMWKSDGRAARSPSRRIYRTDIAMAMRRSEFSNSTPSYPIHFRPLPPPPALWGRYSARCRLIGNFDLWPLYRRQPRPPAIF